MSPDTRPVHAQEDHLFDEVGSPTTPSTLPRGQMDIEALSDLVHAISRGWGGFIMDSTMDMEEVEEEEEVEEADLDAEIEDMDDDPDSEDDIHDDI